jgi:hypothetical protein
LGQKKILASLKNAMILVFGAVDGAVDDVRPKNSIDGSCAADQKCVETPICRIFELSHPNINFSEFCKAE